MLPHGLGKSKRVIVIASGDKVREGREAGADEVGGDDLVQKIQGGWIDFDAVIATPDMMKSVGRLGKILGPRGLMPNPKTGTVTLDVERAVREVKAGKVEFRVDKTGIIHCPVGRFPLKPRSWPKMPTRLISSVMKAKPGYRQGALRAEHCDFFHHGARLHHRSGFLGSGLVTSGLSAGAQQ